MFPIEHPPEELTEALPPGLQLLVVVVVVGEEVSAPTRSLELEEQEVEGVAAMDLVDLAAEACTTWVEANELPMVPLVEV